MRRLWWVGLAAFAVAACSEGGGTQPDVGPIPDEGPVADEGPAPTDADVATPGDADQDVAEDAADTGDAPDVETPPPPSPWQRLQLGADGDLHRVRFLGEHGFRVVGDNGTILRRLGAGWVREWAPAGLGALRDAIQWGKGLSVVGDGGAWLHRAQTGAWEAWEPNLTTDLNGLATLDDALFAVGDAGTIMRLDDAGFSYELNEEGVDLLAAAGVGGDAFAVGTDGVVMRRVAGDSWFTDAAVPAESTLHAVFALDPANVWAVGAGGLVLHFTGGWEIETTNDDSARDLFAVSAGGGRVLAVGDAGAFLERKSSGKWGVAIDVKGPLLGGHSYQGVAVGGDLIVAGGVEGAMQVKQLPDGGFVDQGSGPASAILDIATRDGEAVAVGQDGLLVAVGPDGFGALDSGVTTPLFGAEIDSEGTRWAVGADGTLLRAKPGFATESLNAKTPVELRAITEIDPGWLLAVGEAGTALLIDGAGGSASAEQTGEVYDLLDVFADSQGATAVGRQGLVLRREGGDWSVVPTGVQVDLHAGARAGDLTVVAGAQGTVVSWSPGEAPKVTIAHPSAVYYGVSAAADGSAVLVGWSGAVHRFADQQITVMEPPTGAALFSVGRLDDALIMGGGNAELWTFSGDEP